MKYKDKQILLLVPKFYGYEGRIVTALKTEGLDVSCDLIYKPSRAERVLKMFFPSLLIKKEKKYYNQIIIKYNNIQLDFILVIDGKGLSDDFLNELFSKHPEAKSIYYSWDSMQYFDYVSWLSIFENVFTFDYKDSKQYGIEYLPLFYTAEFDKVANKNNAQGIDLLFIATYKENRLNFINAIIDKYESSLTIKVVLYLSVYRFIVDVIKGKKIRRKDVVFSPLPFEHYLDLLSKTKVVVDYTPASQTGLPMRIPEAVGAKKKLITNNENVRQEFNNSPNILVYKENEDIRPFVNSKQIEMQDRLDYSVSNWIKRLLK